MIGRFFAQGFTGHGEHQRNQFTAKHIRITVPAIECRQRLRQIAMSATKGDTGDLRHRGTIVESALLARLSSVVLVGARE